MKLAVVGHSLAHIRQQRFFEYVASLGIDTRLYCPAHWGTLHPRPVKHDNYELVPLPVIGDPDMYSYTLPNLAKELERCRPDILYVHQEAHCQITSTILGIVPDHTRKVLFVWENLKPLTVSDVETVRQYDLVICGNDAAQEIHNCAKKTVILPQVGVDTDHFQARPEARTEDVGYIGRPVREKGIYLLEKAWPTARITQWTEWLKLPWPLSMIKVIATPSIDTTEWHEQAMPYSSVEAISCLCRVVTSNAGAIPYWMQGGFTNGEVCPGVEVVQQGSVEQLRTGLFKCVNNWKPNEEGRQWIEKYLSSKTIASRLVQELQDLVSGASSGYDSPDILKS